MIREHPRFQQTAIIFISAVLMTDLDFLRGYESGAVDYLPVPIVPEILRAKVKVFSELYRKSRQLEQLNRELEARVAERTAALEASTLELQESAERLRLAFEAARMGWWDCDLQTGRVSWSSNLDRIVGFGPASFGGTLEGLEALVHSEDRDKFRQMIRQGTNQAGTSQGGTSSEGAERHGTGQPGSHLPGSHLEVIDGTGASGQWASEFRFNRPDGSVRWSLVAGQVIRDRLGRPVRFAGVDLDITERKEAEERRAMLARELDHRAKNMLAVVQSVLHLSKADTIADFTAAVSGRIQALSRAHTLLSESRWQGVELHRLVDEEIVPFRNPEAETEGPRIRASGPVVSLPPSTAQSLAVALHELVTNAAKYGALSTPGGRVALLWELGSQGLAFNWSEEGGPPASTPTRRGFGTRVIAASVEQQLGGKARFDWRPEGLRVELTIPLDQIRVAPLPRASESILAGEAMSGVGADGVHSTLALMAAPGTQILLVEDEALIGTMFKEFLTELGYQPVGPIADLSEALEAAERAEIRGAILDVNLGKDRTYPVADILAARSIPFIFVTGYNPADVDRRFAAIPILEKPIDPTTLRQLFAVGRLSFPAAGTDGAALAS
jgi:two-component sensor histidine kinase/PAS domain-containing protein